MSRLSHQINKIDTGELLQREFCVTFTRRFRVKLTQLGKEYISKALPLQELEVKHCFGDILLEFQLNSLVEIAEVIGKHLEEEYGC